MTATHGDRAHFPPLQVEDYLRASLAVIIAQMRAKETKTPDEHSFSMTLHLRCPRPRGMSLDELIMCIEYYVPLLLEERGFTCVYLGGQSDKSYNLRWRKPSHD